MKSNVSFIIIEFNFSKQCSLFDFRVKHDVNNAKHAVLKVPNTHLAHKNTLYKYFNGLYDLSINI